MKKASSVTDQKTLQIKERERKDLQKTNRKKNQEQTKLNKNESFSFFKFFDFSSEFRRILSAVFQ